MGEITGQKSALMTPDHVGIRRCSCCRRHPALRPPRAWPEDPLWPLQSAAGMDPRLRAWDDGGWGRVFR